MQLKPAKTLRLFFTKGLLSLHLIFQGIKHHLRMFSSSVLATHRPQSAPLLTIRTFLTALACMTLSIILLTLFLSFLINTFLPKTNLLPMWLFLISLIGALSIALYETTRHLMHKAKGTYAAPLKTRTLLVGMALSTLITLSLLTFLEPNTAKTFILLYLGAGIPTFLLLLFALALWNAPTALRMLKTTGLSRLSAHEHLKALSTLDPHRQ